MPEPETTREERLEAALRRISVSVDTAQYEDDLYTTPKQSRDSLCEALRREIKDALRQGRTALAVAGPPLG